MKYVPDCDRWLTILCIYGVSALILKLLHRVDEELRACNTVVMWKCWAVFGTITAIQIGIYSVTGMEGLGLTIMSVYLIVCSVTDRLLCQVNDFMQYIGIAGAICHLVFWKPEAELGYSIILFALVQYVIFMRMYGAADGMAFMICSLFLAGINKGMEGYLLHMLVTFLLVTVIQLAGRNITLKGKLKCPIPLYPYILVGFWIMMFAGSLR